jgi:hypothetical protein
VKQARDTGSGVVRAARSSEQSLKCEIAKTVGRVEGAAGHMVPVNERFASALKNRLDGRFEEATRNGPLDSPRPHS